MNSVFRHLERAWGKHLRLQLTSLAVLTSVLFVLNLIFLAHQGLNSAVRRWGRDLGMTLYLKEDVRPVALESLKKQIMESASFSEIQFVSKSDAAEIFTKSLSLGPRSFTSNAGLAAALPASLELRLVESIPPAQRVSGLKQWAERFRANDVVEDVVFGQGWIDNLARVINGLQLGAIFLWVLALSIGYLVVGNCIGLSILQRREEIQLLELVGATRFYVCRPFVVEGLVLGLGASCLAIATSYVLHRWLIEEAGEQLEFWVAGLSLEALPPTMVMLNLFTGAIFGGLGAWSCVRRINTQWSAVGSN